MPAGRWGCSPCRCRELRLFPGSCCVPGACWGISQVFRGWRARGGVGVAACCSRLGGVPVALGAGAGSAGISRWCLGSRGAPAPPQHGARGRCMWRWWHCHHVNAHPSRPETLLGREESQGIAPAPAMFPKLAAVAVLGSSLSLYIRRGPQGLALRRDPRELLGYLGPRSVPTALTLQQPLSRWGHLPSRGKPGTAGGPLPAAARP